METIVHANGLRRRYISRTRIAEPRARASWVATVFTWYRLKKQEWEIREEEGFLKYLVSIRCPHLAESQQKHIEQLKKKYHRAGGEKFKNGLPDQ